MHTIGLRRKLLSVFSVILALLALAGSPADSLSAVDQLDPSFDGDGKLLSPLGSEDIYGQSVLVQTDQKILVRHSP